VTAPAGGAGWGSYDNLVTAAYYVAHTSTPTVMVRQIDSDLAACAAPAPRGGHWNSPWPAATTARQQLALRVRTRLSPRPARPGAPTSGRSGD